jgi:hypothetical protein
MWKKLAVATGAGAIIIGGGAAAVAAASSAPSATAGTGTAAASSSPNASGSSGASAPTGKRGHGHGRLLGRFEHAEWVSRDGTANVTHDAVRGQVGSVNATSISVTAADGYRLTFVVNADTKVRVVDPSASGKAKGKAGTISDVKAGDTVLVSGTKSGSTVTAKHVVEATK